MPFLFLLILEQFIQHDAWWKRHGRSNGDRTRRWLGMGHCLRIAYDSLHYGRVSELAALEFLSYATL